MTKLQTALLLSDALCTLDRIEADIAQVKRDIRELADFRPGAVHPMTAEDLREPLATAAELRRKLSRELRECDR